MYLADAPEERIELAVSRRRKIGVIFFLLHRLKHTGNRVAQGGKVISSLQQKSYALPGILLGEAEQHSSHKSEPFFGNSHAGQGIAAMRIKTGGNQNPLRREF